MWLQAEKAEIIAILRRDASESEIHGYHLLMPAGRAFFVCM